MCQVKLEVKIKKIKKNKYHLQICNQLLNSCKAFSLKTDYTAWLQSLVLVKVPVMEQTVCTCVFVHSRHITRHLTICHWSGAGTVSSSASCSTRALWFTIRVITWSCLSSHVRIIYMTDVEKAKLFWLAVCNLGTQVWHSTPCISKIPY